MDDTIEIIAPLSNTALAFRLSLPTVARVRAVEGKTQVSHFDGENLHLAERADLASVSGVSVALDDSQCRRLWCLPEHTLHLYMLLQAN